MNAFAVEHPDGVLLFDSGQTALASQPGYFPRWHPFFRLSRFELVEDDEVGPQLRRKGIDPTDLRWIVLSHLHTDHIGGMHGVSAREVLVSRIEWERGTGFAGRVRGYLPQHWPSSVQPTLLELDRDGFGPFPGAYDVAGDGTLLVVATPGHTPGHSGLLVRRAVDPVLLSGDLGHVRPGSEDTVARVASYCGAEGIAVVGSHDDCPSELGADPQTV